MARWQPGARERLVVAAVDLFGEPGYDATTVAQIAKRAGVTRSTFFRHFSDKREVLVAGQETLSRLKAAVAASTELQSALPVSSLRVPVRVDLSDRREDYVRLRGDLAAQVTVLGHDH